MNYLLAFLNNMQDENIIDADEDDQLAAAIKASLSESQNTTYPESSSDVLKNKITETYTTDTPSDSDLDIYSGDDSNLSTPVKKTQTSNEIVKESESREGYQKNSEKGIYRN